MNLEEINKWLDNEYGISYTRLEELHNFFFEKYIFLNCILTELEEWLNKEKGYYLCGRNNGKTLLYGKELKRIETIEKIKELKEKYK